MLSDRRWRGDALHYGTVVTEAAPRERVPLHVHWARRESEEAVAACNGSASTCQHRPTLLRLHAVTLRHGCAYSYAHRC